ncbi:hypothetical protein B7494_g1929 [Chlorociboria aeruginascens]|nr:hypothetical protein B7494_g1929 [Chlorociboria aeruginascens]
MRFSRSLKSSPQSLPSPNGAYIATILPSKLSIRETRSLGVIRVFALPIDFTSAIIWVLWSSSSDRLLLASAEIIRVFSVTDTHFAASIANPTSGTARITFLAWGPADDEIYVFSDFGLKLTVFNLTSSRSVDINAPKLYNAGVATKGFSYRPSTNHLALITRGGGKDIISIHSPRSLQVMRSWSPETIDAQGVEWSPDGRWLSVWESSGQGHKLIMYTADGHVYKVWNGPKPTSEEKDIDLGAGVKLFSWGPSGAHVAIGDYSRRITLLAVPSFLESIKLLHTMTVKPTDTLQIWQEQVSPSPEGFIRQFIQASTTTCPPMSKASQTGDNVKSGTNIMIFDKSSTLLASRVEDMPTTIWIWDIAAGVLRTVLLFHAPVAKITWHPVVNELLMIRCEGEESKGIAQLWNPSWEKPKIIDFASQIPGNKIIGKSIVRWLNVESLSPALFFSDSHDCILASVSAAEDGDVPWQDYVARGFDIYGQREESPLNLVAADEGENREEVHGLSDGAGGWRISDEVDTDDEIDDTFRFRKFVEP